MPASRRAPRARPCAHLALNGWTDPEIRARDALFAAMIPGDRDAGLPPLASLDLSSFWASLDRSAPPLLRLGLRATVIALAILPLVILRAPRTFLALDDAERDRFLELAAKSPSYLVRQMVLTVKALACMAYTRDPAVRAALSREAP